MRGGGWGGAGAWFGKPKIGVVRNGRDFSSGDRCSLAPRGMKLTLTSLFSPVERGGAQRPRRLRAPLLDRGKKAGQGGLGTDVDPQLVPALAPVSSRVIFSPHTPLFRTGNHKPRWTGGRKLGCSERVWGLGLFFVGLFGFFGGRGGCLFGFVGFFFFPPDPGLTTRDVRDSTRGWFPSVQELDERVGAKRNAGGSFNPFLRLRR